MTAGVDKRSLRHRHSLFSTGSQCSPHTTVTIMLLHNLARRARPLAARRLLHATAPVSDTAEGATTIHNTSEFLNERELGFMANELVSRRSHGARRWQASETPRQRQ